MSDVPKPNNNSLPTANLTQQDLERLMTVAMQAARAPSPEEQEEKNSERERQKQRRETMRRLIDTERRSIARRQELCRHRKPDGELCIGGQDFSDGHHRKFCLRCGKTIVDEPTPEMVIAQSELQRQIDSGKLKVIDGHVQLHG